MRYTGSKNKLARREKIDLGLKTVGTKSHSNLIKRLNIIPGQHGTKRQRKPSDFGVQLREKQKLKRVYGISERQMSKYFKNASRTIGNTALFLIQILEMRLDNVLYRLGLAPTRASARQLINHGHVLVNKKKVTIPSYQVKIDDVVSYRKEKIENIGYIGQMLERDDVIIPEWLQKKANNGIVQAKPTLKSLKEEIDLQQVVEFYSR